MNSLEEEFIPNDLALAMREIGFDEPCLKYKWNDAECALWMSNTNKPNCFHTQDFWKEIDLNGNDIFTTSIPTYSQCFKWFREKHNLYSNLSSWRSDNDLSFYHEFEIYGFEFCHSTGNMYFAYEESQLECLKQLIKLSSK